MGRSPKLRSAQAGLTYAALGIVGRVSHAHTTEALLNGGEINRRKLDPQEGLHRFGFGPKLTDDPLGWILPMQDRNSADSRAKASAAPEISDAAAELAEAQEALIRAAATEILNEARAELIPDHLRNLATELAEALRKTGLEGAVECVKSPTKAEGSE